MPVGYGLADGSYIIPVGFFPDRRELFWPTGIIRIPVVFDGLSVPSIELNGSTVNGLCMCYPMSLYLSPSTAHDGPRVGPSTITIVPCHARVVPK
jgi:hypothetical protein